MIFFVLCAYIRVNGESLEGTSLMSLFPSWGWGEREERKETATNSNISARRRGAYQSYVNIVYGIAAASGAALGGLMADKLGWRWEFGIQVFPIAITLCVTAWVIPPDLGLVGKRETLVEAMKAFDFGGSLLLTTSITFMILGLVSQDSIILPPCLYVYI